MISKDILDKMDHARRFLAAPAPEVVGDLIAEIRILTAQRDRMTDLMRDIHDYAKGKKPHDYHNLLGSSNQITARFDAWQEIECKIEELLRTTQTQPK